MEKNHRRKARNDSFDSYRKALSYLPWIRGSKTSGGGGGLTYIGIWDVPFF